MDRYFPVISKSTLRTGGDNSKKRVTRSQADEISRLEEDLREEESTTSYIQAKFSPADVTKFLLNSLSDKSNPITHSTIGERADHVVSVSTGHQVGDGRSRHRRLLVADNQRLQNQKQASEQSSNNECQILRNVRVYIDGFLNDTTDIEMKRIVSEAGGLVVSTASRSTHILTSQQLSGSKTHKVLMSKARNRVFVVKPEWVFDSIKAGRKRSEREYAVIKNTGSNNIFNMMQK